MKSSVFHIYFIFQLCFYYSYCQMFAKSAISSFKPGGQYILLTFDDGPHAILTPKLLDILKEKKVKATFFVIGLKAKMHPEILARMKEEGHEIANHTWNHPVLTKIPTEQLHAQLEKTNKAVFDAIKSNPEVMRPPYGNTNPKLNDYITSTENLKVILWSLDTNDWKRPDPEAMVTQVMGRAKPGDIILCHDIHPGTIDAMPLLIDALHSKGYQFLTVTQMLGFPDDSPHRRTSTNLRGTSSTRM